MIGWNSTNQIGVEKMTVVSKVLDHFPSFLKRKEVIYVGFALVTSTVYVCMNAFSRSSTATFKDQMKIDKSNYFQVSDTKYLEWFEFGASEKEANETLLMLHGAMTTGELWKPHDEWAKKNHIRIISPTLPGWGLTPLDRLESTPVEWATEDCAKLMISLGFGENNKFNIAGGSLGTIYTAAFASHPETCKMVKNVMLYVSFSPQEVGRNPLKGSQLEGFQKMHSWPLFARLFDKFLILPMLRLFMPGDANRAVRHQWEGLWKCTDDIASPWPKDWRNMAKDRKVFIVSGSTDDMTPVENQIFLFNEIKGSELITYVGGHDDHIKDPLAMQENLIKLF